MPGDLETNAVMTVYEKWALIMSAIAILIPIIQWAWKKWIVRPRLNHYHTGNIYLFINQSGSYMRVDSVYEAINKPISIKNISANVERLHDHSKRDYVWSSFLSPTNLRFIGNNAFSNEIAHPFRIDSDNICCAFTEFADKDNSAYRSFSRLNEKLLEEVKRISITQTSYEDALTAYTKTSAYEEAKRELENELYWRIGTYSLSIIAEYEKKKKCFQFQFEVTQEQYQQLQINIDETVVAPLKQMFGVRLNMQMVQTKLNSK